MPTNKNNNISKAKSEQLNKVAKSVPQSSLKKGLLKEQEDLKNLRQLIDGQDQIFVYNATKGAFHLAPTSSDALEHDKTAHKFALGEIRVFSAEDILSHKDFLKAIAQGKLQIKNDEEVSEIEAAHERALKKSTKGTSTAGVHASGLSNNRKAAIDQIWEIDDTDLLEDYKELDDRQFVKEAIDARIEEIDDAS